MNKQLKPLSILKKCRIGQYVIDIRKEEEKRRIANTNRYLNLHVVMICMQNIIIMWTSISKF